LIGDGIPGIRFAGSDALADALTAPAERFHLGRDICTVFDFAATRRSLEPARQAEDVAMAELDSEHSGSQLGTS
jgi:hypothetical protein